MSATAVPPPAARDPAWHADWMVPDWPAPPRVRAVCTTRAGGVSAPPCDSMNLGHRAGDDARAVQANRARLARATGVAPAYLRQVHGADAVELPASGAAPLLDGEPVADASYTRRAGTACTVLAADCMPVLLADRTGRAVAAAHAGWRGLAAGVLEQIAACLRPPAQALPTTEAMDLIAWLGPCIGPSEFEVGADVRSAFLVHDAGAAACFAPHPERPAAAGKWLADLPALARRRLAAVGVSAVYGNDGSAAWCTVSQPSRFFSHRRDAARLGGTGRMAACIWIDG